MQYRNILHLGLLLPVLLSLSGTGCSGDPKPAATGIRQTPIIVITARPSQSNADGVTTSGQVEAIRSASISTRLTGTITHVYARVGDKVAQGQLLATINSEDIAAKKAQADAQIAGAQASLDNARKDFDRYNVLFSRQSATASELDNASLRYHAAISNLEAVQQIKKEVEASAAYARLTAPFTGVITQRLMDEGSLATPGSPLLTIEEGAGMRVNAAIAESDISRIKKGDSAQIDIKSTGLRSTGVITEISTSSIGGQYTIKISLPANMHQSLYSGMYVNVFIPVKKSPAGVNAQVLVPGSALVEKDQLTGIYTISNSHTALLRWIRTGQRSGDMVEILSGLNANEPFILSASGRLYDGAPVQEKQ